LQISKNIINNFLSLKYLLTNISTQNFKKKEFLYFTRSNDFEYFFYLYKYFLFFKNFNKFFFINFLFFKNFSKNNLYFFNKSLFIFLNTLKFVHSSFIRKKSFLKNLIKTKYSSRLLNMYPETNLVAYGDFMYLKRFFKKHKPYVSNLYRKRRFFFKKNLIRLNKKSFTDLNLKRVFFSGMGFFFKKNSLKKNLLMLDTNKTSKKSKSDFNKNSNFSKKILSKKKIFKKHIGLPFKDKPLGDLVLQSKTFFSSNFLYFNMLKKKTDVCSKNFLDSVLLQYAFHRKINRVFFNFLRRLSNLQIQLRLNFKKNKNSSKNNFINVKYIFLKKIYLFYITLIPFLLGDRGVFIFFRKRIFSKNFLSFINKFFEDNTEEFSFFEKHFRLNSSLVMNFNKNVFLDYFHFSDISVSGMVDDLFFFKIFKKEVLETTDLQYVIDDLFFLNSFDNLNLLPNNLYSHNRFSGKVLFRKF